MKIVIVTNGIINDLNHLEQIIIKSDYVICADGAARYLAALNIYPDLLVGDLDSISPNDLKQMRDRSVKIEEFPTDKDMTDTELAIEYALELNPTSITIVGALGLRWDHSLGNIMLLAKMIKKGVPCKIIDEKTEITIVDREIELEGNIGDTISLIPLSNEVKKVTLEGLKYPLLNKNISFGSSLGISNAFIEKQVKITVGEGLLLVVRDLV
ncbi:MAG: thiamine diphosphokinase [Alkaliphilus sp.]|nr:MAG: thiamine diphosphokinase [Alkaliphilus sp.]